MVLISDLEDFVEEAMDVVKELDNTKSFKYFQTVLDDSELSNFMKNEFTEDLNTGIFLIVPEYKGEGSEDNMEYVTHTMLFFVDKTDYSEHDHESYLKIFRSTQVKVKAFVDYLLAQKDTLCWLTNLSEDSIDIKPVWKKAGCNGWSVSLSL